MSFIWNALAGIASGIVGAMGLGGGGVLVLYLVLSLNQNQMMAQGINLLFFIPTAIISLIIHNKNHLVKWKLAFPMMLAGLVGVGLGTLLIGRFEPALLQKIFAVFLFLLGIKELFWHKKSSTSTK